MSERRFCVVGGGMLGMTISLRLAQAGHAVTLLEAAGYANVGKTNLHEFAYGVTSQNPHFGTVPKCGFSDVIP